MNASHHGFEVVSANDAGPRMWELLVCPRDKETLQRDGASLVCRQGHRYAVIDDVPILALTLSSKRYGDFELRRIAAQVDDTVKQVPDVSAVTLIGGQRREIRIVLDEGKLAAYNLSPLQVAGALGLSNQRLPSDRKSTRLNSSHELKSRMPSSA